MLLELEIANFVIIKKQCITFGAGLNVISGETGAGKSIVLEALKLLLGARSSADSIRAGEETLSVRGLFEYAAVPGDELPHELLLTREVSRNGRSRVSINGKLGSVAMLEEISKKLISICGQNENLALLDPRFHMQAIDRFCGNEGLLTDYAEVFSAWREARRELGEIEAKIKDNARRNEEFQEIIKELEPLKLQQGIRAELESRVREISGGEKLNIGLSTLIEALRSNGPRGTFSKIKGELRTLQKISTKVVPLLLQLEEIQTLLAEFENLLTSLADSINVDEEQLEFLRERLSEVARFERKYRTDDLGLLKLLDQAKSSLSSGENEAALIKVQQNEKSLREKAEVLAAKLSASRVHGAEKLAKIVERELSELAMSAAKLNIKMERCELSSSGAEKMELLMRTNKGEEFKALRQIASGGELSRIMLVLHKALRDRLGVYVLVFDELDSGISGAVARAVGEKLKELSADSQVICITHLPQVASLADRHILVQKQVGKRTETLIKVIEKLEKVEEIARMLAGHKVTESARRSAQELLNNTGVGGKS